MQSFINKILDKLADLVMKSKLEAEKLDSFAERKPFKITMLLIILGFLIYSITKFVHGLGVRGLWLLLPGLASILFFIGLFTYHNVLKRVKQKSTIRKQLNSFDFNFEALILKYIHERFTRMGILKIDETPFELFHIVFTTPFEDNEYAVNFYATQPELKYILDKFKRINPKLTLAGMERSQKIWHKGKPIKATVLSKKGSEQHLKSDFVDEIDSIFEKFGV